METCKHEYRKPRGTVTYYCLLKKGHTGAHGYDFHGKGLERAPDDTEEKRIAEAVAAERERCSRIADEVGNAGGWNQSTAQRIGTLIRKG